MQKKDYLIAAASFVLTFSVGIGLISCNDSKQTQQKNNNASNGYEQEAFVGGIVGGIISEIMNGNNSNNENNLKPDNTPVIPPITVEKPIVLSKDGKVNLDDGLKESGETGVIQVINNAEVSIAGTGTLIAEEENGNAIAVWANSAKIKIESGSYGQLVTGLKDQYPLIYATNGGSIEILGGTFKSATPDSTLVCDSTSSIVVTGGSFYKFNPSTQVSTASAMATAPINSGIVVPVGYETVQNGDWYVVQQAPFYEDENGDWHIRDAEGLVKFQEKISFTLEDVNNQVDVTDKKVYDKTVFIDNDIDLFGIDWKPINIWDGENNTKFIIDGQGYTIKNMTVQAGSKAGFFGGIARDMQIKDLTFDNASVTTSGSFAGVVIGHQYGDVVLDNVKVLNSQVKTTAAMGIRVGGLVGFSLIHEGGTSLKINNCEVKGTQISGFHNVAGFVGSLCNYDDLSDLWDIKSSSVIGCTINVTADRADSIKYGSVFAVEGNNYPHTYAESNDYFKKEGNTENGNIFNIPENNNIVRISNATELKQLRDNINNKTNTYNDGIILIEKDINLAGELWTPIDLWDSENSSTLTIYGQGHVIKNMTVQAGSKAGFIGSISRDITIKNMTFDNASITTSASFAGVVIGYQYADVILDGVKVYNSIVQSTAEKGIRVGGLVGLSCLDDGATIKVINCAVSNSTISAYHNVSGLIGTLQNYVLNGNKWTLAGNVIEGCTFEVTATSSSKEKFASAFAVDHSYPHTYEESNEYFVALGNEQSANTFIFAE